MNETSKFWLGILNDLKKFSSNFKSVYNAPNESAALSELETIKEKWGKKYPYAISNWENNREDVSSFFQFSGDISSRYGDYSPYPYSKPYMRY